jgi:hypothetical protein
MEMVTPDITRRRLGDRLNDFRRPTFGDRGDAIGDPGPSQMASKRFSQTMKRGEFLSALRVRAGRRQIVVREPFDGGDDAAASGARGAVWGLPLFAIAAGIVSVAGQGSRRASASRIRR